MGEKLAATFWASLIGGVVTVLCGASWMALAGLQGGWLLVASSLTAAAAVTCGHFLVEWASDKAVDREMRRLNDKLAEINAAAARPPSNPPPKGNRKWDLN